MMNRIEYHKALCDRLHKMYEEKNSDYGDSFRKVREEFPNAICIRLSDKLNRVKALMMKDTHMVKDESVDDTLLDLANYALLELVEREAERTEKKNGDAL